MHRYLGMIIIVGMWSAGVASAENVTWNNVSTENGQLWSTSTNWSPAKVPAAGDTVTIANGGTVDLGTSGGTFLGNVTLSNGSIVSNNPGGEVFYIMPNCFSMTEGTVNLNVKRFLLGTSGTTVSTISGGTFTYQHNGGTNNGSMRVGAIWSGQTQTTEDVDATLNIQGKSIFNVDRLVVGFTHEVAGRSASGTVVIEDSATVTLGKDAGSEYTLILGHNATGSVTVKDSASLSTSGTIFLGSNSGKGTFTLQDSGTLTATNLQLNTGSLYSQTGGTATISGRMTLNDGGMVNISGGDMTIQNWSIGTGGGYSQSGGTVIFGTAKLSTGSISISGAETLFHIDAGGIFEIGGETPTDLTDLSSYANFTLNSGEARFKDQIYVAQSRSYGKLTVNGGKLTAAFLQLSGGESYLGEMEVHGGEITISDSIRLGRNGSAHLIMDDGKITTPNFYIGGFDKDGTTSDSSMTFSKGEVSISSSLHVGGSGKGTLDMSGGALTAGSIYIGREGEGSLKISGKTEGDDRTNLTVDHISVGRESGSMGTMEITGGYVDAGGLYLAYSSGAFGSLAMSGGELKIKKDFYVGRNSAAEWKMTGGDVSTEFLCVGWGGESSGVFNISDGRVTVRSNFRVGLNGTGTGTVSGGDFTINRLYIQGAGGKESSLTIVGNESTWKTNEFTMVNNLSKLNFVFDKGGFSTLASGTVSLASGAKISAEMNVQGIQTLNSNTFELVTGNSLTDNGVILVDSPYWDVSLDGNKVVAKLQNYFTDLPQESVTEGVLQWNQASDSLLFYSDILDSETMDDFTAWLEGNSDDVSSATGDEQGNVLVQFAEVMNYLAFNFNAFNLLHADNPASLGIPAIVPESTSVPEPATWGMLILGMFGLWRFCGRKKQVRVS